jgi:hypothetical protein
MRRRRRTRKNKSLIEQVDPRPGWKGRYLVWIPPFVFRQIVHDGCKLD